MRRQLRLRARRRVFAGALGLATILTASASTAAQVPGQDAIKARPVDSTWRLARDAQDLGRLAGRAAGVPLTLGFRPPGGATSAIAVTRAHLDVLAGDTATVGGRLRPAAPGRTVSLELKRGEGWQRVARARTRAGGAWLLRYRPASTGTHAVRVRLEGAPATGSAVRRLRHRLSAYGSGEASYYGPGMYGGGLACGGTLEPSTLGVASKTLPCGTMVTLHYGSNTVRVPVIDRGPYVSGRIFDLTEATKQALGFPDLGTVWYTT